MVWAEFKAEISQGRDPWILKKGQIRVLHSWKTSTQTAHNWKAVRAITFSCWNPSPTHFGTVSVSYLSVALQDVSSFLLSSFILKKKKNHLWELSYLSSFFQLFCVQVSPLICTSVLYNDFTPASAYFPNAGTKKNYPHSIFFK